MKPLVKSAVESALIAALVALACLWFLISGNTSGEEVSEARMAMLGIGLGLAVVTHLAYMGLALKRDGRPLLGWMLGMVLLFPVGSIVALVLMSARAEEESRAA
jgi:hypothetical protein